MKKIKKFGFLKLFLICEIIISLALAFSESENKEAGTSENSVAETIND